MPTTKNGKTVYIILAIVLAAIGIHQVVISGSVGTHDECATAHLDIREDVEQNRLDIREINKALNKLLENQGIMLKQLEKM